MPELHQTPTERKTQDIQKRLNKYEKSNKINNCYDTAKWGVHISCMDEYQPATSFIQAMKFVNKYNTWIINDIYPYSEENDPPMIASVFKWDSEEHGEHNTESVNWENPF